MSTTTPRHARGDSALHRLGLPLLGVVATVALWQWVCWFFDIRPLYLPSPLSILGAMRRNWESLLFDTWVTVFETLAGFAVGTVAGLLGALLLAASPSLERATMPLIIALNAVPKVAVAPLLVVWLGYGHAPRITLAATICFFPIMIAALAGLTSTPAELGELARSLTASKWQTFGKVRIPHALPQVFVGLKLGMTLALIGTVVAEINRPGDGLGSVISISMHNVNMSQAFAAIVLLMVLGIGSFYLVVAAERLVVPWARETAATRT